MAKRPTIGENPLDALVAETHLDAVVPPKGPQAGRPREKAASESQKRLAVVEAEVKALKEEIFLLRAEMTEMQAHMPAPEPKWVVRLREKLAGK
ncbi:MAG: hypothetical protein AB2L11_10580 [Syntrophobacteraceae bacterium]